MTAVSTGVGTNQNQQIARLFSRSACHLAVFDQADTHGVDQRVAFVGVREKYFAANVGNADAVAVRRNAADNAVDQVTGSCVVGLAESKRIEEGDRSCTQCEDVANNSANAGSCTFERLDGRRVVV